MACRSLASGKLSMDFLSSKYCPSMMLNLLPAVYDINTIFIQMNKFENYLLILNSLQPYFIVQNSLSWENYI